MDYKVIGIEGLVGAGKTSICRELLKKIPNSILLHGGNIYRAIMYAVMNSGIDITEIKDKLSGIDVKNIMEKFKIEIKIENRESVIFIDEKKIDEEQLQAKESSMAVSMVSGVADNTKLYEFGKNIINQFKQNSHVILSSRDIMKMYPETDYHFLITAELKERVRRKYIQYKGDISQKDIEEMIKKRDDLQEKNGYYNTYKKTQIIDVTECKNAIESANKVMGYISIEE